MYTYMHLRAGLNAQIPPVPLFSLNTATALHCLRCGHQAAAQLNWLKQQFQAPVKCFSRDASAQDAYCKYAFDHKIIDRQISMLPAFNAFAGRQQPRQRPGLLHREGKYSKLNTANLALDAEPGI